MGRRFVPVTLVILVVVASSGVCAQSAEQDVRNINEALNTAARSKDKAAYAKLLGNDLRWIGIGGRIWNKTQWMEGFELRNPPSNTGRDIEVRVYGDTAVLMSMQEFPDRTQRNHRVFVKRNGQWLLVSHSATTIDPNAK